MIEENYIRLTEAILNFLSTLGWPIAVVIIVYYFRKQIEDIIPCIRSFKYPGGEFEFQRPDLEATKTLNEAATQEKYVDARGFYTKNGLTRLISNSGLIQEGEEVVDMLLLFDTQKQHTWIISTNQQIFCVLDDVDTRASRRMIQWRMPLSKAEPIRAKISFNGNPVVDIGERSSWLYSQKIYPSPEELEDRIRTLIDKGQEAANKKKS